MKKTKPNVTLAAVCALTVIAAPLTKPLNAHGWGGARQTSPDARRAAFSPALRNVARGALSRLDEKGAVSASTLDAANRFQAGNGRDAFLERLEANAATPDQKRAMRVYGDGLFRMVETAYRAHGYNEPDWGVAWAALLETAWEINDGSFKIGGATETDIRRTKASVTQLRRAIARTPGAADLSDADKEFAYQFASFTAGHMVLQWQQAGRDEAKREAVKKMAREQLTNIFGVAPAALSRRASGEFARAGGGGGGKTSGAPVVATTGATRGGGKASTQTQNVRPASGPLPAAKLGGAQVFIRYTITYLNGMTTNFDHLILFPDGSAFLDVPSKPVARFDPATLRAGVSRFDVGTWKKAGAGIALSFPEKREPNITLRKHARGWYDASEKTPPKPDSAYDVYFPIVVPTARTFHGARKTQSLTTMGTMGGGTAMVAAGSSGNRVYRPDGTLADANSSFASATTANMGDAFKSGGDVTTNSQRKGGGAGRWRVDGPLLTMEINGVRTVQLAFILPHWGKKAGADLLINGDWWKRPEK